MSALRFCNIVIDENKQYDADMRIGVGAMQFSIH